MLLFLSSKALIGMHWDDIGRCPVIQAINSMLSSLDIHKYEPPLYDTLLYIFELCKQFLRKRKKQKPKIVLAKALKD